ncbi:unnamed protein product, partial [Prorocentrum cordatum]
MTLVSARGARRVFVAGEAPTATLGLRQGKLVGGAAPAKGKGKGQATLAALPPGPLPALTAAKANELAVLAEAAGDSEGSSRYRSLAARAPPPAPAPTLRDAWRRAEQRQAELESKLETLHGKLRRWRTSMGELCATIQGTSAELEAADQEVAQTFSAVQAQAQPATQSAAPTGISIRALVDGQIDLTKVFTVDDFMGTSALAKDYELDDADEQELCRRKDAAAQEIQQALQTLFQGAVDKAKQAMGEHTQHVQRLEGKKRRVADEQEAANAPEAPPQALPLRRAAPPVPRERPPRQRVLAKLLLLLLSLLAPTSATVSVKTRSSGPLARTSLAPDSTVEAATQSSPTQAAKASLFYANITEWGPQAERWVASAGKNYQLRALVESHTGAAKAQDTFLKIGADDWRYSKCDAVPTMRSAHGTTGGEMVLARKRAACSTFDGLREYSASHHEADPCCGFAPMTWHRAT